MRPLCGGPPGISERVLNDFCGASGIIALVVLGAAATSAWLCAFCLLRSCVTSGGSARLAASSTTAGLVSVTLWVCALMHVSVHLDRRGDISDGHRRVLRYACTSPVARGGVHVARLYRCFGPFSGWLVSVGYCACIYLDRAHSSSVLPCYVGAGAILWAFAATLASRSGNVLGHRVG